MSQIGARAQALEGKSADEILRYYYKDIEIAPAKDDHLIRINIGHLLTQASVKTNTKAGVINLYSGDIKEATGLSAVKIIPSKVSLVFSLQENKIIPSALYPDGQVEPLIGAKMWTLRWSGTRTLSGAKAILGVTSLGVTTKYRYGQIQIKLVKAPVIGNRIEVTNTLRLHDEYLWGIGEVPSSWPLAALQAQVIASRSFALSKVGKIRPTCDCELYSSAADQSFVGYSKESEVIWGKIWKEAVISTSVGDGAGRAIIYEGVPIAAYFFSSSAGQTLTAAEVWGREVPYTMPVADPWSLDPTLNSRYFHWERAIDQSVVAAAFELPEVVSLEINGRSASGGVAVITGTSASGMKVQLTGYVFRSKVKLPSIWFDFLVPQVITPTETPTPNPTVANQG